MYYVIHFNQECFIIDRWFSRTSQ